MFRIGSALVSKALFLAQYNDLYGAVVYGYVSLDEAYMHALDSSFGDREFAEMLDRGKRLNATTGFVHKVRKFMILYRWRRHTPSGTPC